MSVRQNYNTGTLNWDCYTRMTSGTYTLKQDTLFILLWIHLQYTQMTLHKKYNLFQSNRNLLILIHMSTIFDMPRKLFQIILHSYIKGILTWKTFLTVAFYEGMAQIVTLS